MSNPSTRGWRDRAPWRAGPRGLFGWLTTQPMLRGGHLFRGPASAGEAMASVMRSSVGTRWPTAADHSRLRAIVSSMKTLLAVKRRRADSGLRRNRLITSNAGRHCRQCHQCVSCDVGYATWDAPRCKHRISNAQEFLLVAAGWGFRRECGRSRAWAARRLSLNDRGVRDCRRTRCTTR